MCASARRRASLSRALAAAAGAPQLVHYHQPRQHDLVPFMRHAAGLLPHAHAQAAPLVLGHLLGWTGRGGTGGGRSGGRATRQHTAAVAARCRQRSRQAAMWRCSPPALRPPALVHLYRVHNEDRGVVAVRAVEHRGLAGAAAHALHVRRAHALVAAQVRQVHGRGRRFCGAAVAALAAGGQPRVELQLGPGACREGPAEETQV